MMMLFIIDNLIVLIILQIDKKVRVIRLILPKGFD